MICVSKTGVVRLKGDDLERLRTRCYERDEKRCVDCNKWLRFERDYPDSMHMAHVKGRGAGGSDTLENVLTKCFDCHIQKEHNAGGKPCPRGEWRKAL